MISHRFEERAGGVLTVLAFLAIYAAVLYVFYLFYQAWTVKNVPDMIGYGFLLVFFSPGVSGSKK